MPISNEATPSPAQRAWWLWPELIALTVLMLLLVSGVELSAAPGSSRDDRLADQMARALEQGTPADHRSHGHAVETGQRVVCTAEVYGEDSRGEVIYGYYMCAAGAPGTPWEASSRVTGPCMMRLTNPPKVLTVVSGQGYEARVRAMLPDQYEAWAFQGFRNKELPARLITRYNREVAAATTS